MEVKDNENIGLKSILVGYLLHWKLFLAAFVFSLILGVLYLVFYPKTYEIYSSIQLQDESELMSSGSLGLGDAAGIMKSFGLSGMRGNGINLDDEMAILASTNLANKMVLDLGLNVEYFKPYAWKYKMYENSPLQVTADSSVFRQLIDVISLDVSVGKNVKVGIKVGKEKRGTLTYESLPVQIELKEGAFTLDWRPLSEKKGKIAMKIDIRPSMWVAEEILEELNIEEFSKTSNIVELSYNDYEKKRAVDLLSSLISQYNIRAEGIKKDEAGIAYQFVESRIEGIVTDLVNAEEEIEAFKQKNDLTDLTYDIQFFAEQMKDLQIKILEIQAQIHVIDLMNSYISDPANKYNVVPGLLSVKDGESAGALTVYNDALIERLRMLATTSEDHPTILAMNDQIDKLRDGVFLTIRNAQTSIGLSLSDLKSKEKMLFSRMKDVPTQERQFIELKRNQEILQGVYLILLQKREEIALTMGKDRPKANLVDVPFVKKKPVGPRKLFAAIGILFFTIILPVGYLFGKDQIIGLISEIKKQWTNKT